VWRMTEFNLRRFAAKLTLSYPEPDKVTFISLTVVGNMSA